LPSRAVERASEVSPFAVQRRQRSDSEQTINYKSAKAKWTRRAENANSAPTFKKKQQKQTDWMVKIGIGGGQSE